MKIDRPKFDVFLGESRGADVGVEAALRDAGLRVFNPLLSTGSMVNDSSRSALRLSRAVVIVAEDGAPPDPARVIAATAALATGGLVALLGTSGPLRAELGIIAGAALALGKPIFFLVKDPDAVRRADFPRDAWVGAISDVNAVAEKIRGMEDRPQRGSHIHSSTRKMPRPGFRQRARRVPA